MEVCTIPWLMQSSEPAETTIAKLLYLSAPLLAKNIWKCNIFSCELNMNFRTLEKSCTFYIYMVYGKQSPWAELVWRPYAERLVPTKLAWQVSLCVMSNIVPENFNVNSLIYEWHNNVFNPTNTKRISVCVCMELGMRNERGWYS